MYRALLITSALLFLTSGFVPLTHAQVATTDPLTVDISSPYPSPYQTIKATPSSTLMDMAASTVSITVNGQSYFKGTGATPVSITLGGPGTSTTIVVTVVNAGKTYTKKLTLRPASVALVVEPVSTTHPFYEGRGLVSPEGRVRLIAIPDLRTSAGTSLNPATLIYTWHFGDQLLTESSGIGKSVLEAAAPKRYRDATVSVTVQSPDGILVAQAQTNISPVDPLTHIYRNDPLLGPLFDWALSDTITMQDTEETYRGVGYYFSENPIYSWLVNGSQGGSTKDVTVRATGSGQGTATLGFSADQTDTAQSANSSLSVIFGTKKSLGIFGL